MKAILKKTFYSLVGCLALWSPAYAQNGTSSQASGILPDDSAGRVVLSNTVGTAVATPFGPRGFVNGVWGQGAGYDSDQVDLGVLIPKHIDPGTSLFMLMLQGSVTEDGDGVGNFGVGYRYYSEELDRLFGISTWYTTDDSGFSTYDSVGLSLENVGRHFTMRFNGNFVTNDDASLVDRSYISDEFFFENYIGVTRQDTWETPYHYAELLFGTPLPVLGRYGVTAHVGPYGLFHSDEDGAAGVKVAVEAQITEDIRVLTNWQNDSLTGSTTNVSVSFAFPHRRSSRYFRQTPIENRMGDWWIRPNRVSSVISREVENVPLTNPKDLEPIFVVHLDPNALVPGDGTYESPYASILEFTNAPNIDIIRVLPREDGTPTNLQNNGPLVLFDCQRLLGSSIEHIVDAVEYSFVLPEQTGDSLPIMQNLNNDSNDAVVILANMNEVSGIQIDGTGVLSGDFGNGIISPAGDIEDFNINRNLFVNYRDGVNLSNVFGTGLLTANEFDGSGGPSDDGFFLINTNPLDLELFSTENNFHDNGGVGSNIIADAGTMTIFEENNTANLNGTGFGHRAEIGATIVQTSFSNNSANENTSTATGAVWDANGGTISIERVFGNEFLDNAGSGAVLSASLGGDIVLRNMHNNRFAGNGIHGLQLIVEDNGSTIDAEIGSQDMDSTLLPNVMENNGQGANSGDGINLTATNGGRIDGLIHNTQSNGNDDDGLGVYASEGTVNLGDATHSVFDASFNNNGGAGVELFAEGGTGMAPGLTDINAYIFSTTINGNSEGGIVATATGDNADIELIAGQSGGNNTITNNGEVGVGMHLEGTATGSLIVSRNTINGTSTGGVVTPWDGVGVGVYLLDDAELTAFQVTNNTISGSAADGVRVETFTQSVLELGFIDDNNITNSGGDGIFYRREGNSILDNQFIRGNNITGNSANGINIYTAGSSTDFRDASLLELNFTIGDGGAGNGNNISNNSIDGILLHSTGDANQVTNINGNTVDNNGADGLHAFLGFFASLQGVWQNNTFNSNNLNGMILEEGDFLQVTRATYDRGTNTISGADRAINVDLLDNFFNNNGQHGLFVAVTSELDIDRNEFTGNGLDGMEFFVPASQDNPRVILAPSIIVRATENLIADNEGIGVNIFNADDFSDFPAVAPLDSFDGGGLFAGVFTSNQILRNGYDGVSIWNDDNDETLVDLFDNLILNNAGYGVRIQNYDDDRQNDGVIGGADAFARVNISGTNNVTANQGNGGNSRIDNNGLGGIFATNGANTSEPLNGDLVQANLDLRVFQTAIRGNGTSANGFDDAADPNYLGGVVVPYPDSGNGLFVYVGTVDFGGIEADIRDNYLSGNESVDVVFQSYTEIDPASLAVAPLLTSSGSINGAYQPDPLARLDLRFTGNVGETIDATRQGAYFDNADPFKSPAGGGNLFNSSSRRRNAQREALDVLRANASVIDPPAPTAAVFEGTPLNNAANAYQNNYVIFTGGVNSGQTRLVLTSGPGANATLLTTDPFGAAPTAGDPFQIWGLQVPGIGDSTFRTEETNVNTNNTFDTVISDFNSLFNLGFTADEIPYPFNWQTGIALPVDFPLPTPIAVP
ncbi:MAG: right-handed parallel beta-helix repeat-containing protein [Planctomycetaceae bacterium]|nr:right-handed parallel beta-helix repeat-containing protein [Planctomycetaceae bacterium]